VLKPNIAHQRRIGKVCVNGGIRPIADDSFYIARNITTFTLGTDIAGMVATVIPQRGTIRTLRVKEPPIMRLVNRGSPAAREGGQGVWWLSQM